MVTKPPNLNYGGIPGPKIVVNKQRWTFYNIAISKCMFVSIKCFYFL